MSDEVVGLVTELLEQLRSPDTERRRGAALVLGSMALSAELLEAPEQARRALRPLIAALADTDVEVRALAARSIGQIVHEVELVAEAEEALAILSVHFRADDAPSVRAGIVDGLMRLGGLPLV